MGDTGRLWYAAPFAIKGEKLSIGNHRIHHIRIVVTHGAPLYRGAIRGMGMWVVSNTVLSIGRAPPRPGFLTQSLPLLRSLRVVGFLRCAPPD